MSIEISHFAKRQYQKSYPGVQLSDAIMDKLIVMASKPLKEVAGYASFCKILVLKNRYSNGEYIFKTFKSLTVEKKKAITQGASLHTAYEARSQEELPVLVEWATGIKPQTAHYIHLILYSRKQMEKEKDPICKDWGVVAVNASMSLEVEPMKPITAMRNALGVKEGGSGVAIDKKRYKESVNYWSKYVLLRP